LDCERELGEALIPFRSINHVYLIVVYEIGRDIKGSVEDYIEFTNY